MRRAQARLERVRLQASTAALDPHQRQNLQILQQEQVAAEAELAGIEIGYFGAKRDSNHAVTTSMPSPIADH